MSPLRKLSHKIRVEARRERARVEARRERVRVEARRERVRVEPTLQAVQRLGLGPGLWTR